MFAAPIEDQYARVVRITFSLRREAFAGNSVGDRGGLLAEAVHGLYRFRFSMLEIFSDISFTKVPIFG